MTPERFAQIEELYHAALARPPKERAAFLAQVDPNLRSEVELLLEHDSGDGPLARPPLEVAAELLTATEPYAAAQSLLAGQYVDQYRILAKLGEGGMGVVYLAEQEQPRRVVALKIIKPGWSNPELLRRFQRESQALGRLQHPGIAQIHEAGTADTGFGPQPYLAMELIQGESLRKYDEARHLDTRQRLELMAKVCDAVHHAHQRGIIHRDLKPGNILVDETGQPKILDFGVARIIDSDTQMTRQTDLGQLVGTLAYMSPEQVLADPLELDTRSDVYSLGLILYELLAGRLPYHVSPKLHEAMQTIREADPTPLSSISRSLRGDIETIVAKTLEKDKSRRYASAADLAGDIRRYLDDQPITARPPSAGYQLQKFARRHRALVAGVAAVFVVLVGGIVASTWQAVRADRAGRVALAERDRAKAAEQATGKERDRALSAEELATSERNSALAAQAQAIQERNRSVAEKRRADDEAATAKAVSDFLQGDLLAQASAKTQASPATRPDPDLKVRTALDRAAARIAGKFDKQPLVEASIRQTIGNTYAELGLYPEAQRQMEQALELRRRVLGAEHLETLGTMDDLAGLFSDEGKYAQAEPLYANVLEIRRRALGEEHPATLSSMNNLAVLYRLQGNYVQAAQLYTNVLEIERRVLGEDHPESLTSMSNLAVLYRNQGKYAEAEALQSKVLEIRRRVLGEDHPQTLISMYNVAVLYRSQGKYAEAEVLQSRTLELRRRVLGEEHPETLASMNNLANVYLNQRKYAEAEPIYVKTLELSRRVLGEEHPETLTSMGNLAVLYRNQGKYAEAQTLQSKALDIQRRVLGEEHPDTLLSMGNLAGFYRIQRKYAEAEPIYAKTLELRRRVLGEEHPDTLRSMSDLASLYRDQGKDAEAEPLLTKALGGRRRVLGQEHPDTINALVLLGETRLRLQKYGEAEPLLREALTNQEKAGPNSWNRYYSQSMLGASLTGQKKYADAEPLLLSGYDGMIQREATIPAASQPNLARAGEWIVQLYQEWGKPAKAVEWQAKLDGVKAGEVAAQHK